MSKKDDIRYNGSGYYDETAFKAIQNTDRGGIASMENFNKGEIWEVETANGSSRKVLLLKCFDDYAVTLTLVDFKPEHTYMQIKGQGLMYMDCARLGYNYYDKLTSFVRTVSDEDMQEITRNITTALDLAGPDLAADVSAEVAEKEKAMSANLVEVKYIAERLQKELDQKSQELKASEIETIGITRERDIYKELYTQLLSSLLKEGITCRKNVVQ